MNYSIRELSQIWQVPHRSGEQDAKLVVNHICYDTRMVLRARDSLFIALSGKRADGHDYLQEAYDIGIRVFLIDDSSRVTTMEDWAEEVVIFLVKETLAALQKLAQHQRARHGLTVVGITGSNGKTIVKEWLGSLLTSKYQVCKSPQSFNSQLGVALSVLQISEADDIGLLEAGISQPGEMAKLQQMIQPQLGILTNIGDAHDAGFESRRQKLQEKLMLFGPETKVIYCRDHEIIHQEISIGLRPNVSWSLIDQEADYRFSVRGKDLNLSLKDQSYRFELSAGDQMTLENACHAIVTAIELGLEPADLQDSTRLLRPLRWRTSIHQGPRGNVLINDSYNHDITGLEQALSVLKAHGSHRNKVAIIAAPSQSHDAKHDVLIELLESAALDELIIVSPDPDLINRLSASSVRFVALSDIEPTRKYILQAAWSHTAILFKGPRALGLERLATALENQSHRTRLHIDLAAVTHNLRLITHNLPASTKILCMVKAASYGTGDELVRHLATLGVDMLGVAFIDEAVNIRQAGIDLPILVMHSDVTQLALAMKYQLELQINGISQLQDCCDHPLADGLRIQININTGMNRLGLNPNQIDEALEIISKSRCELKGVMSHLATADSDAHETQTLEQLALFSELKDHFAERQQEQIDYHVLNSHGTLKYPRHAHDMVRIGIAMYGVGIPETHEWRAAHELRAQVVDIRSVPAGQGIGYGHSYVASQNIKVATISCGYADGLPRILSGRAFSFVHPSGKLPLIGKICMDFCMVDATAIPELSLGDEVVIFGPSNPLSDLCLKAETIPYEILAQIPQRVQRIYHYDSK